MGSLFVARNVQIHGIRRWHKAASDFHSRRRYKPNQVHQPPAPPASTALQDIEKENFRETAPWIPIGHYEKKLMSHLKTSELFRATLVLHLCRIDTFVKWSHELFRFSRKLGPAATWLLRKTFFEQFVGGETEEKMKETVDSMHERGTHLMLLPVLEADVSEIISNSELDKNLKTFEELLKLTFVLEPMNSIFQLKASAIIPTSTLKAVSEVVQQHNSMAETDSLSSQAHLIEMFTKSIDTPSSVDTLKSLGNMDKENMVAGLQRADALANLAKDLGIKILVDAEFVSCKAGISLMAHCLMARHNGSSPVIGNTTQAYLKGALTSAAQEWDLMQNILGVHWAGKIVRGAYLDREKELAQESGYESPVHNSYPETNRSYNSIIYHILEKMGEGNARCKKSHLIVASHNERSIRLAAHLTKEFGLEQSDGKHGVSYAQVFGMSDYLSTPLVQSGYHVYKSTPYGPMESVLPYLSRRASENRAVIHGDGARQEREMLAKEIKSRSPLLRALF